MLKKIRIVLGVLFFAGITLMLLDFTGTLHLWLGWMAKIQLLPAIMALNVAVIAALIIFTLLFGRIYCSVICPLGVFQDGVAHLSVKSKRRRKNNKPYGWSKEKKWLRYIVWVIFVAAIIIGVQALVALLAPYSAWGRIVQNLFQPIYIWVNNLLAAIAERANSYAFYNREVWMRSLPTFIIAAVTLVAIVILAWRGGRTYCNTICPVGTTLSFFSRFAMFRPVIDTEKCINCKICEHHCKASCINIDEHKIDYSRCVDCFNCLEDCKMGAMKYRFAWKRDSSASLGMTDDSSAGKAAEGKAGQTTSGGSKNGRRAFLTGAALAAGSIALKAQEKKTDGGFAMLLDKQVPEREVPLTPPGSKSVKDFYKRCTACQLCVAEYPNNVLRPSASLEHLMQPEMSFEKGWCRPECTRCSELCPTGAIGRITREQKTRYQVGLASVNRELCVAEKGTECGNCARHCPAGAIEMVPIEGGELKHPVVNEALCTSCGACENLCPVRPLSAITVNGRHNHIKE